MQNDLTISRSCSCSAKASSLLSIQEAAATSRGVDPRIPEQITFFQTLIPHHNLHTDTIILYYIASRTQANATVLKQVGQMIEHGALVLTTDAAEIAQETAAVRHHLGESNLLLERFISRLNIIIYSKKITTVVTRFCQYTGDPFWCLMGHFQSV